MLDTVGNAFLQSRETTAADNVIFRLTLTGATPLSWRMRRDGDLLRAEIDNVAAGNGGCWVEKIELDLPQSWCRGGGGYG